MEDDIRRLLVESDLKYANNLIRSISDINIDLAILIIKLGDGESKRIVYKQFVYDLNYEGIRSIMKFQPNKILLITMLMERYIYTYSSSNSESYIISRKNMFTTLSNEYLIDRHDMLTLVRYITNDKRYIMKEEISYMASDCMLYLISISDDIIAFDDAIICAKFLYYSNNTDNKLFKDITSVYNIDFSNITVRGIIDDNYISLLREDV